MLMLMLLINLFSLVFVSFILNSILVVFVQRNYFGSEFRLVFNNLCHYKINLVTYYYFIFISVAFLIIKLNINYVYLDTVVNINLSGTEFVFKGDYIKQIADHFGETAAFALGARLASALIVKKGGMTIPKKIGVLVCSGVIHAAAFNLYRHVNRQLSTTIYGTQSVAVGVELNVDNVQFMNQTPDASTSVLGSSLNSSNLSLFRVSKHQIYTYKVQGITVHSNQPLQTSEVFDRAGIQANF